MWALNGSIARFLLDDGVSAFRLAQLRSFGSWLILLVALALFSRRRLRVERAELPALAFLGLAGLAAVHAAYFAAIDRLQIGAALTIQYMAPALLLVWLRVAHGRRLRPALWGAMALSLAGCFLVVRAYDVDALDGLGVAAAFGATLAFAIYMVGSERAGHRHEPVTTLFWGFGFASLFWAVVLPWWSFPFGELASADDALYALGVVVIGTLLPFLAMVAALRRLPAARGALVATLEPVLGAVFAWIVHGEALAAVQIAGGVAVIAAIAWIQRHRPDAAQEAAPPLSARRRRG